MAAYEDRYLATSAVGNFLIGRRGSRWLVVSTPGDVDRQHLYRIKYHQADPDTLDEEVTAA